MISEKERAKRFQEARTVFNVNGNQTQRDVYKQTGIYSSMISDIESPVGKPRPVAYQKVVALADHYGVNVAWLIGQSDSPSLDENRQMITDTTGLSDKAVSKLQEMKQTQQIDALNLLLESVGFSEMLKRFTNARRVNAQDHQSDQEADLIEGLQDFGIFKGMESKNSRFTNRQITEMYRQMALESISKAFNQILREEKGNG